ncbi:hypothetical protein [Nocardioides sp. Leaf285]|uniref:hypothetical protein n=1 Tax=Nocardioides sp. Leaf285 TaxID=1736322 RepID=UPI00070326EE|nr:hypothetical protein [Nocardioides sp. Leaf285]KQP63523.1 hypothetical protein ASF47_15810 [Nocardioides sp. Leaf285]
MSDEECGDEPAGQPDKASNGDALDELREELQKPVDGQAKEVTLSPEELARVKESMARLQGVLNPKFKSGIADLIGANSFLKKFERMGLPDSAYKSLMGRLPDSTFTGLLGKNLVSKIHVEPAWVNQMNLINSDAYKMAGLGQSNLTRFNSLLAGNAIFDVNERTAKMLARFSNEQTSLLQRIAPLLEKVRIGFYPGNLRDIEGIEFAEVEEVVMLDGIALYGVPRQEIAEKLLRAENTADRRNILGRRWKAISSDCRIALAGCSSSIASPYLRFAVGALDALDAANPDAAQAMAASVLDTVVNDYFGKQRYDLTPNRNTTDAGEYDNFTMLEFIAFAPLWKAYQQYRPDKGDLVPRTFSRHASVHGVGSRQFSRRNAVQAVLFVSSLLVFLDEEAAAVEVA